MIWFELSTLAHNIQNRDQLAENYLFPDESLSEIFD